MHFETRTTDGVSFLALMTRAVSEELVEKVASYVQTNIVEFGKFQASQGATDNFKHCIVYAVNEAEKIVGFRYFLFEPSSSLCHLFATFVDSNYRRQGVATRLIEDSFNIAASYGCTEFEIRLTQPSPEKDALFNLYRRYANLNLHRYKFTIYYWGEIERYGYAQLKH